MGRNRGRRENNELRAERTVSKFLRKHKAYKVKFGDYCLVYDNYEVSLEGDIVMKYRLVEK